MSTNFTSSSFTFTCQGFQQALASATDETIGDVRAAIRSAMNKMVSQLKSLAVTEIVAVFNVSPRVLGERLRVFRARMSDLEAELRISGKSIPLPYFGARQVGRKTVRSGQSYKGLKTTQRRSSRTMVGPSFSGGVEVQITRGVTTVLQSAFLARMKSGHVGVFRRGSGVMKSRAKYGYNKHSARIKEQAVVSIASMVEGAHGIHDKLAARVDAKLEELFWHELEFFLSRSAH
jgi:hypothetical protein